MLWMVLNDTISLLINELPVSRCQLDLKHAKIFDLGGGLVARMLEKYCYTISNMARLVDFSSDTTVIKLNHVLSGAQHLDMYNSKFTSII